MLTETCNTPTKQEVLPQPEAQAPARAPTSTNPAPKAAGKPEESFILPTSGRPPIPRHVVQAIKAGKYVDLSDLLPEALWDMQFDDTKEAKARDETKRRRYSIHLTLDWSVAFATYTAVASHFNPSRAFALSAYTSIVVNLAKEVGRQAWHCYDKVFRQAATVNPSLA